MSFMLSVLLYLSSIAVNILTSIFSPHLISYYGHFSHPKTLLFYSNLPHWIVSKANFDGIFYLRIAQNGYSQFEQAFFPLYPFLIRLLSPIFANNLLVTGLITSNICFIVGLFVFKKYLNLILKDKKEILWSLAFFIFFPTAFFFTSLYTESLFFLFTICFFYFLKKEKFLATFIFGFLAAATRFIGVFLFVPPLIYLIMNKTKKKKISSFVLPVIGPVSGLIAYSFYLYETTGDFLAFFHSQTAFLAGRSTSIILFPQIYYRYLKIFVSVPWGMNYFVAILEVTIFTAVFFSLLYFIYKTFRNIDLTALNSFSLLNILIPTLTGTFLSIPRFVLLSLGFFIFLAQMKNNFLKMLILIIFILLEIILLAFFTQGYFMS